MAIEGTLFEYLADMRKWLGQPFNPHLPELKVSRLAGYIDGYLAARIQLGSPDLLANQFFTWLTEHGDHPQEGWAAKLLRDYKGDEVAVIRQFLDLTAEFIRNKGGAPAQDEGRGDLAGERAEREAHGRNWEARHVADLLGCSELTVKRMARAGKIPAVKIGRSWEFYPAKVRAFLGAPGSRRVPSR